MEEFVGKYTSAKVYCDNIDDMSRTQIQTFLDHEAFEGCKIRVMSDVHAGKGSVIGFTCTLGPKVVPNTVGVDGSCGVTSVCCGRVDRGIIQSPLFDKAIRRSVPIGFNVRDKPVSIEMLEGVFVPGEGVYRRWNTVEEWMKSLKEVCERTNQDYQRVLCSIGTMGGNNHFIELERSTTTDETWATVHTGSRNFGLRIAEYHQNKAISACGPMNGLEYLTKDTGLDQYLFDEEVAAAYANFNRSIILMCVAYEIHKLDADSSGDGFNGIRHSSGENILGVSSVHNYIDFETNIIRKGAVDATKGKAVIIPWNQKDGVIIGEGLGNEDWNFSAPHGAGRSMSRAEARRTLDVDTYRAQMALAGVYSSSVGVDTLEEAPDAYKSHDEIEKYLGETVKIVDRLTPIYVIKSVKDKRFGKH